MSEKLVTGMCPTYRQLQEDTVSHQQFRQLPQAQGGEGPHGMLEDSALGGSNTSNHSASGIRIATVLHIMPQGHFRTIISI